MTHVVVAPAAEFGSTEGSGSTRAQRSIVSEGRDKSVFWRPAIAFGSVSEPLCERPFCSKTPAVEKLFAVKSEWTP